MTSAAEPWLLENGTTNSIPGDIKHGDGDHDHGTTTTTTELASPSVCGFLGFAVRTVASLRRLWIRYYPGAAVGQQEGCYSCKSWSHFRFCHDCSMGKDGFRVYAGGIFGVTVLYLIVNLLLVAANCQEQTTFEAIKVNVPGLGSVLSSIEGRKQVAPVENTTGWLPLVRRDF